MSIHPSLRGADTLSGDRSVLTRVERIQKLLRDGKFDGDTGSAWGLPKVRTKFKVPKLKVKKEDVDEAAEAEAEAGESSEG